MMIDYKKLTVEEIKMMLIKDSGGILTEAYVDSLKGKTAVVEAHQKMIATMAEGGTVTLPEKVKSDKVPRYTDPEWEDFLLSQLTEKEMDNGYPKVSGLRRLTEVFLGEIIASGPVETDVRTIPDYGDKAIVTFQVTISWNRDIAENYLDIEGGAEPTRREFRAVASSWSGNTDNAFAAFPEAIAETRAEARALRRALRISKVSSDEITRKDTALVVMETMGTMNSITDIQKTTIATMCGRLGIDVTKFINSGSKTYPDISMVDRDTASKMIGRLNDFQASEKQVEVPEELKVK